MAIPASMSGPVVFVSTQRIIEGKLDAFKQFYREGAQLLEADKPLTVFFQAYLNEEGTEETIVHVFPDADAMDLHMQGAGERSKKAFEFIQPERFEIYGTPSDQVLAMMRQVAGPGINLIVKPQHLGGFIRLTSG